MIGELKMKQGYEIIGNAVYGDKKSYLAHELLKEKRKVAELEKRVDLLEKMIDKSPYDVLIDYINKKIEFTELAKTRNKFGETNFERSTKLYLNALFQLETIKDIKMKQVETAMKIIDTSIEMAGVTYGI